MGWVISMSEEVDISLIIPVYNVEKYLERTLKSVENQTFKNFEVVIVNDGSTDRSMEIIEKFMNRNSNFVLVDQENAGVGAARNAGIKISRGMYIAFLDSDDFLEPEYLEKLYFTAIKTGSDIVCCNFYFYYESTRLKICCPINSIPGVYSGEKALKKITSCIGTFSFLWNKLFKRSLFTNHKIEFYNMYFEDSAASPELFFYANTVTFIPNVLYNYVMRETSILHTMNAKKINDFMKSLGIMRNFYEKKGIYKKYRRRMKGYAGRLNFIMSYDIFMMHLKASNFRGLINNIRAMRKSIKHFMSDNYKGSSNKPSDPIFPVKDPEKEEKGENKKPK